MGKLLAVCISEKRGTAKKEVREAVLRKAYGIEGDAHAGAWHRQVSLLGAEKIEAFQERGVAVCFGMFGENLVVEGFDLRTLPVGTRLKIGDALLELTQIGKECHAHCAIYAVAGDCIMPREGVFARVLEGGTIRPGDRVDLQPPDPDRPFTAAVVTLSDRACRGEREDKSGPLICELLAAQGYAVTEAVLLPDGRPMLEQTLIRLSDQRQTDVIFTTGGTGFGERDVTPEATEAVCDRMAPGIAEAMRAGSMRVTKHAMLSRQTAGIRKKTLIINLPGSPKACREDLEIVLPALAHGLGILRGTADN